MNIRHVSGCFLVVLSILPLSVMAGTVRIDGGAAYATIQNAVDAAINGDRVLISTGMFFEAVLVSGKNIALLGGYDEGLVARPGGFTGLTSSNQSSVLWFNASSSRVDQVNICNGIANAYTLYCGGGCVMNQSWVEFTDSAIFSNQAVFGGGLYVDELSQAILTGRSRVYNNIAASYGGGMYVKGRLDVMHEDSDIVNNVVSNGHGGGIYLDQAYLQVSQGDVLDNIAATSSGGQPAGGGIGAVSSEMVLGDGMLISNNMAMWGGGISMMDSTSYLGRATMGDVVFDKNTAWFGAGVQAWSSFVHSRGTTFRHNAAIFSGGAGLLWGSDFISDTNMLFVSKNHAGQDGGGFYLQLCQALLAVVNFGFGPEEGNEAGGGGGALYLTNSEVWVYGGQFIGNRSGFSTLYTNGHGGAIAAYHSGLVLTNGSGRYGSFTNVIFSSNEASNYYGGGIYLGDESHANFYNGWASVNLAQSGGMLYVSPTCNFYVVNCEFTGNVAMVNGGGIAARGDGTVHESRFFGNKAGLSGGGIQAENCAMEVGKSAFIGNDGAFTGGGISLYDGAVLDLNTPMDTQLYTPTNGWRSLFRNNSPDAMAVYWHSMAAISRVAFISNNLSGIDVNAARFRIEGSPVDDYSGSAIRLTTSTGDIASCTMMGAISLSGDCGLTMSNSLVTGIISTGEQCALTMEYCDTTYETWPGPGNITNWPLLYPGNYHQRTGSATINAGGAVADPLLVDGDGESRFGAASDIGFDEFVDDDGDELPTYMETGTGHIGSDYAMGSNPFDPDSDNDGFLDGDEWAADTDPNLASSCLRFFLVESQPSQLNLHWQGGEKCFQYLEGCTNLVSGDWFQITILSPPTATATNYLINDWYTCEYYRIRAERE